MIARVWHGYTTPEHADAYEAMLKPELLPGISKVNGYKGSYLLRRNLGHEIEFITILLGIRSMRFATLRGMTIMKRRLFPKSGGNI